MSDSGSLRVLVVIAAPVWDAANSNEPPHLDTRKEWKKIVEGIEKKPIPVCLERLCMPTERELDDALAQASNDFPYSAVHISAHGAKGFLALDDGYGRVHRVDARTLGETFNKRGVQLVVLNTCHSADAPSGDISVANALVEAGVPAVIGMTRNMLDLAAVRLSDVLYQRLASDFDVIQAVEDARKAIKHDPQLKGLDADVPIVLGNGNIKLVLGSGNPGIFINYPPNNLFWNAYFFGRSKKLVQIAEALSGSSIRVVAINGLGGIGKSAMAAEAALRNASLFHAIVWTKAKEGSSLSLETLKDEVRRLLKLNAASDVLEALNTTSSLLVLDDLHWLAEADWPPIAEFLSRLDPAYSKAILTYRSTWQGLTGIDGLN